MTDHSGNRRAGPDRLILAAGLVAGLAAVILGALGAHGPLAPTDPSAQRQLDTATLFHLTHSLGLMILAFWPSVSAWRRGIALTWVVGIPLFSGSLYALTMFASPWPGPLTPLGGLLLIIGWLGWLVGLFAIRRR